MLFERVVLNLNFNIAEADHVSRRNDARIRNSDQRPVDANLQIPGETIAHFEHARVLPQTRIIETLEHVVFVAELQVKLLVLGDVSVVGVEGLLRKGGRNEQEQKKREQKQEAK